jgi:hypothetical protein
VNPRHLRWADQSGNEADKVLHGRSNRGNHSGCAKLTVGQVLAIRRIGHSQMYKLTAAQFGINESTVRAIVHRVNWRWLD